MKAPTMPLATAALVWLASTAVLSLGSCEAAFAMQTASRQTPAEQRARAYLELFNFGGSAELGAYVRDHFAPPGRDGLGPDARIRGIGIYRHLVGPGRFVRFDPITETKGNLIFRSDLLDRLQRLSIEVEAQPPHRIIDVGWPETIAEPTRAPRNDAERGSLLDAYARRLADARSFSGVIVLARGNRTIFQRAYGDAEWRFRVPNALHTRFNSASITKTFTAVAIAQLVEQGKVSWDDRLSRFLPDFPTPEAAENIRIHHLLAHTSGLGAVYPETIVPNAYRSVADFIATAPRTPPATEPGATYRYSNLGYLLLGRVIEIASGQDYYNYIAAHIFTPAGMVSAGMEARDSVIPRLAYGYEPTYSVDRLAFQDNTLQLPARPSPFGSAYVTAADLLRFGDALRRGVLIRPETWALMTAPKPELGSPNRGYGFAVTYAAAGGARRAVGHDGNQVGMCTSWRTVGDSDVPYTFIILSNSGLEACRPIVDYMFDLVPFTGR